MVTRGRLRGPLLRKASSVRKEIKILTEEQVSKVIRTQAKTSRRLAMMWKVTYSSGCRISEVLTITPHNVEVHNSRIYVPCLKWERVTDDQHPNGLHEWKWVTIDPQVAKELNDFIHLYKIGNHERIFPYSRNLAWYYLKMAGLKCGIKGLHPHLLRHSLATNLIVGGMAPELVAKQLKHRSVKTTVDLYVNPSTDDILKERARVRGGP